MGKAFKILGYNTLNGGWWRDGVMLDDSWYEKVDDWDQYDKVIKSQAEKYDAFEDYPWMYCFEKCDHWFPGSKFILTVRDPDKVAESDIRMWRRNNVSEDQIPPKSKFISRYNKHYQSVLSYFKGRDNLLIINLSEGDGWAEVCNFLDKPIPDQKFPHLNKGTNRKQHSTVGSVFGRIIHYFSFLSK